MSKDTYTKIINTLAKGCMGLRYSYFSQGMVDGAAMKRDIEILGDFQGKDGEPWSSGICFGLSVLYLAACTPKGRATWTSSDALTGEFSAAFSKQGASAGMLQSVAQAFVRQKGASIMRCSDMENPEVLVCKGCSRQYAVGTVMAECMRCGSSRIQRERLRDTDLEALARLHHITPDQERTRRYEAQHATVSTPALQATLQRYRAKERHGSGIRPELDDISDKTKHAVRDQLVANYSLKPSPPHDAEGVRRNYKSIPLSMADAGQPTLFRNHLKASDVDALVSFVGEKNTFSLFGYERMFVGGHQMAFWSDGSRTRFFDPNFGVISFSFQSGLKTFLSRYIPFLYYWKGKPEGEKKSATFMSNANIEYRSLSWTTLDFDVYRYAM